MPSISSLSAKLQTDFPQFTFLAGNDFHWSPETATVHYDVDSSELAPLLHELAHAVLNHEGYTRDIQLIEMERDAWRYAAQHFSKPYDVTISEDDVEDSLDTYRDWLHSRSTCPDCQATGIQTKKNDYKCLACHAKWRVNDGRACALRRYILTK